eukprot:TRINITY_DN4007_c0_g1_i1.p1 TRINITY_DN4007_c0_g1~~TRINITY_DN4007_c0_g1_i1.p1  ORF type:complete len:218 (+),score=43.71 TRINITY_DN4007_c0_g1_i1:89-742(+)
MSSDDDEKEAKEKKKEETKEKDEKKDRKRDDRSRSRDRGRDREKDRDRDRDRDKKADGTPGPLRTFAGAVAGLTRPAPANVAGRGVAPRVGPPRKVLDRARTCPFLLRIFRKIGGHHGIDAFRERGKEPVDEELQVYSWPDVTLRELVDLIKDVAPEARAPNAKLSFNLIYPDKTGKNVSTTLGTVTCAKRGPDDDKALSSSKFQTGDLLDLAIYKS